MKKWYVAILTGLLTIIPTLSALADTSFWGN